MKRIGIDARLYFQTGIGTYIRNLAYNLEDLATGDLCFYMYVMKQDAPRISFPAKNFIKREVTSTWHSLSEQIRFLSDINEDNLDLMHFTYFSYPLLYSKPFIATIHDATPLLFKTGKASTRNPILYEIKHFIFKKILKNQVQNSRYIITPTKTVKNQITALYGSTYGSKIAPIYEGINRDLIEAKENTALKKTYDKPFFIYVGNFYPHKNVERLIRVFSRINRDIQLLLIGPNDFFAERLTRLIDEMKQEKRIRINHSATPGDLKYFYKNAIALIHPSLSEGFGLPLIEAAYFNCPVIASDILVFRELLGSRYTAFDPLDENDMVSKIRLPVDYKRRDMDYGDLPDQCSFQRMTESTLDLYRKYS